MCWRFRSFAFFFSVYFAVVVVVAAVVLSFCSGSCWCFPNIAFTFVVLLQILATFIFELQFRFERRSRPSFGPTFDRSLSDVSAFVVVDAAKIFLNSGLPKFCGRTRTACFCVRLWFRRRRMVDYNETACDRHDEWCRAIQPWISNALEHAKKSKAFVYQIQTDLLNKQKRPSLWVHPAILSGADVMKEEQRCLTFTRTLGSTERYFPPSASTRISGERFSNFQWKKV